MENEVAGLPLAVVGRYIRSATVNWSLTRRRSLALWTMVLCGLLLAAQSAKADSFLFNDTVDTSPIPTPITLTNLDGSTNTRVTPGVCTTTGVQLPCGWNITQPVLGDTITFASFTTVGLSGASGTPEANLLSDELSILNIPSGPNSNLVLQFASELEGITPVPALPVCAPAVGGIPCTPETGGPVPLGFVQWQSGNMDTFFAASDVETTVPEPTSLILFGSGLAIAGGILRRRRKRVATPSVAA